MSLIVVKISLTTVQKSSPWRQPLGLETFTNLEQEDRRVDFARLAGQRHRSVS